MHSYAAASVLSSIAAARCRRQVGNAAAEACLSGCQRDVHVEGEGFGVGVVVPGVALQGGRDG
jgi:hypothetical protein